ncbi:hypothetical protein XA68_12823 [Ophiocordyceps unilateralis]|uniref:Uncharacterized protein n=1 Tax=Ophiocordyceps unilateralis TaxID=268505 RepID=A0A2A9PDV7_OPHUN|nr:hypothetical protein XA68_12823 [Ophiocordyceps unilateralis]
MRKRDLKTANRNSCEQSESYRDMTAANAELQNSATSRQLSLLPATRGNRWYSDLSAAVEEQMARNSSPRTSPTREKEDRQETDPGLYLQSNTGSRFGRGVDVARKLLNPAFGPALAACK